MEKDPHCLLIIKRGIPQLLGPYPNAEAAGDAASQYMKKHWFELQMEGVSVQVTPLLSGSFLD
ncbi:MAG: hypothetical protein DWQ19_12875 [Crenarchaeota archaeon]|nr:MAG: hypothetical protein DWQ19_12875 [Thermoproteota archaeon]